MSGRANFNPVTTMEPGTHITLTIYGHIGRVVSTMMFKGTLNLRIFWLWNNHNARLIKEHGRPTCWVEVDAVELADPVVLLSIYFEDTAYETLKEALIESFGNLPDATSPDTISVQDFLDRLK